MDSRIFKKINSTRRTQTLLLFHHDDVVKETRKWKKKVESKFK